MKFIITQYTQILTLNDDNQTHSANDLPGSISRDGICGWYEKDILMGITCSRCKKKALVSGDAWFCQECGIAGAIFTYNVSI